MRQRGFTFVEVLSACTVAGVLASVALPAWQGSVTRAHRADAVTALARVQAAQERHRANTGRYAADLAALQLGAQSEQGLYELALQAAGADGYRASARAVGAQAADTECPHLLLDVNGGFAQPGPSRRCWNR